MRIVFGLILCSLVLVNAGCLSELTSANIPLSLTAPPGNPIDTSAGNRLSGVYTVIAGNGTFGDTVVALWVKGELCLYSGSQAIFVQTAGSLTGDTARFDGYYLFVRSAQSGGVNLQILPSDGGRTLGGHSVDTQVTIRGTYDSNPFLIERRRPVHTTPKGFYILGNNAGGRNSDRLGRSENSIEMGRFCQYLGCNGVEIDLHETSDDTVILIHDDSFGPRTVETTYILGDVWNFTFKQIRDNARLINGEVIPTLNEFLTWAIDSSDLDLVWLDPKVTTDVEKMLEEQQSALAHAKSIGRKKFRIVFGIPTTDMLSAYRQSRLADSTEVLCELTPDDVRSLPSCKVWAPRWTLGLQASNVASLQSQGYQVFPWTIDSPDYMTQFLNDAPYDGILSDLPSILTGLYFQR
jgi:glycerophosphoryl diester phosphodiesterase